jgi:hypothetical protein
LSTHLNDAFYLSQTHQADIKEGPKGVALVYHFIGCSSRSTGLANLLAVRTLAVAAKVTHHLIKKIPFFFCF